MKRNLFAIANLAEAAKVTASRLKPTKEKEDYNPKTYVPKYFRDNDRIQEIKNLLTK